MIPWSPVDLFRVCAHNGSGRWFTFKTSLSFKSNYVYIYIYIWHIDTYRYKNSSWVSSRCGMSNLIRWSGKVVELRCASGSSIIFTSELCCSFKCSWYCVSASLGQYQDLVGNIDYSQLSQTNSRVLFSKKTFQRPSKKRKKHGMAVWHKIVS